MNSLNFLASNMPRFRPQYTRIFPMFRRAEIGSLRRRVSCAYSRLVFFLFFSLVTGHAISYNNISAGSLIDEIPQTAESDLVFYYDLISDTK